jgi:hypothetical protein
MSKRGSDLFRGLQSSTVTTKRSNTNENQDEDKALGTPRRATRNTPPLSPSNRQSPKQQLRYRFDSAAYISDDIESASPFKPTSPWRYQIEEVDSSSPQSASEAKTTSTHYKEESSSLGYTPLIGRRKERHDRRTPPKRGLSSEFDDSIPEQRAVEPSQPEQGNVIVEEAIVPEGSPALSPINKNQPEWMAQEGSSVSSRITPTQLVESSSSEQEPLQKDVLPSPAKRHRSQEESSSVAAASPVLAPQSHIEIEEVSSEEMRLINLALEQALAPPRPAPAPAVRVRPIRETAEIAALCQENHPSVRARLAKLLKTRYPTLRFLNRAGRVLESATYFFEDEHRPCGGEYCAVYIKPQGDPRQRVALNKLAWISNAAGDKTPYGSKMLDLVIDEGAQYTGFKCYELGYKGKHDALWNTVQEPTATLLRDKEFIKDVRKKCLDQIKACTELQTTLKALNLDKPCNLQLVLVLPPSVCMAAGKLLLGIALAGETLSHCPTIRLLEQDQEFCALSQPLARGDIQQLSTRADQELTAIKTSGQATIMAMFKPAWQLQGIEYHHFNLLYTRLENYCLHFLIADAQDFSEMNQNLELAQYCNRGFTRLRDEINHQLRIKNVPNGDPMHRLITAVQDSLDRLEYFIQRNSLLLEPELVNAAGAVRGLN